MTAARIPEPREWLLTRTCSRCGESKPWAKFPPKSYWPDGRVRTVGSWCTACKNEMQRERWRTWPCSRTAYSYPHRLEAPAVRRLPVEPTRAFILRQLEDGMGIGELAAVVGLSERTIYRVVYEHENVSLRVADTIATRLGAHLYDLYPDLMEAA